MVLPLGEAGPLSGARPGCGNFGYVNAIEAQDLTKVYGRRRALDQATFTARRGEVLAFLGPNGAGKTTAIRILTGMIRATSGSALLLGEPVPGPAIRRTGTMIEEPTFYPYLSGADNLRYVARLRGDAGERRVQETIALVGLEKRKDDAVRKYSQGMRQRLGLARALLAGPELLILDEPTNGLDPEGIVEVRETIRRIAGGGVTVFLASHLLAEVERVADRVLVIHLGKILAEGDPTTLRQRFGAEGVTYTLETNHPDRAVTLLKSQDWTLDVAAAGEGRLRVSVTSAAAPRIATYLVTAGLEVTELVREGRSLENAYLDLLEQSRGGEKGVVA